MAQLRQDYTQFEAEDTVILVVVPENADGFANYIQENDLPFTGLPDPKHNVLKTYSQEVSDFIPDLFDHFLGVGVH